MKFTLINVIKGFSMIISFVCISVHASWVWKDRHYRTFVERRSMAIMVFLFKRSDDKYSFINGFNTFVIKNLYSQNEAVSIWLKQPLFVLPFGWLLNTCLTVSRILLVWHSYVLALFYTYIQLVDICFLWMGVICLPVVLWNLHSLFVRFN